MQQSKGVHVSVNVQYKPLPTATVASVMQVFESPFWANFMIQYIVPYLKSYKPASQAILQRLAEWKVEPKHNHENNNNDDDEETCAICMNACADNNNNNDTAECVQLPCGHEFHAECVRQWLTRCNTCPNCRHEFQRELSGRFVVTSIKTSLLVDENIQDENIMNVRVGGRTMHAVVAMTLYQVHDNANYGCDLFVQLQQATTTATQEQDSEQESNQAETPTNSRASRKRSASKSKMEAAEILKRLRTQS